MTTVYVLKSPKGELLRECIGIDRTAAWSKAERVPVLLKLSHGYQRPLSNRDRPYATYFHRDAWRKACQRRGWSVVPVKLVEVD